MTGVLLANVLLAVLWAAVSGSFSLLNVAFGFVLSSVALWLIREQYGTMGYLNRVGRALSLFGLFLWELLLSAIRVAFIVLKPNMNLRPAFFAYDLRVDRDVEITLLANMITLTPGTLSVDVSNDRKTLYIHCLTADDLDSVREGIANGFERKILETFR
ncbi:MAG: Na+/H+ antiporter subunit E [Pseudomonadota bacterium]